MRIKQNKKIIAVGLAIGIALVVIGGVGALNGWFGGGATIPEDTFTRGLVGYWSMDEGSGQTAYDSSDYSNDGTLGADSNPGSDDPKWTTGKVAGAMQFDGVDDYVDCGNAASLNITDTITIEAWVKPSVVNVYQRIVSEGSYNTEWIVGITPAGKIGFEAKPVGLTWVNSSGNTALLAGNYYHIVGTIDTSAQEISLYLNGQLDATPLAFGAAIANSGKPVRIGREEGSLYFNGIIDEVRIYNRALSAAEVRFHYSRGAPVGYWKFDEGTGTLVGDLSDNMNNAIIHGPSLSFDGTDDYVDCTDDVLFDLVDTFTFTAWVKVDADPIANNTIHSKFGSAQRQWIFRILGSNGHVNSKAYGALGDNDDNLSGEGTTDLRDNKWHHIVAIHNFTKSGNDRIKIYIDGVDDSATVSVGVSGFTGTMASGGTEPMTLAAVITLGATYYGEGLIDEVRIYDRVLSATEIKEQYSGIFKNESGLVGYWPLDENTGDTAYDHSTNSNNGNLAGACPGAATCPTWTSREGPTWTTGKYGNALSFDGTDDFLVASNNIGISGNSPLTMEGWINPTTVAAAHKVTFGIGHDAADTGRIALRQFGSTWRIYSYYSGGYQDIDTGVAVTADWQHVSLTYNGDNFRFYKDGILGFTGSSVTLQIIDDRVVIGNYRSTASSFYMFNGLMDEVRIYDYARTADEIRLDYNAGFTARFGPNTGDCDKDPGACMRYGLVGYWSFDEGVGQKAEDQSGEGNDGTVGSSSSSDTNDPKWTIGKKKGALEFDGANDYVNVSNNSSVEMNLSDFTVESWVKTSSIIGDTIVTKNSIWALYGGASGFNMRMYYSGGAAHNWFTEDTSLQDGEWHHLVSSVDRSGYLRNYADGKEVSNTDISSRSAEGLGTGVDLVIGGGGWGYMNGSIDEVRVYNRALSAAEVRYHYNEGGPVAQWKFNEGRGTTAYDESDNSNDGTLKSSGLDFDGTNDYVEIGSIASTSSGTMEAWIKPGGSYVSSQSVMRGGESATVSTRYNMGAIHTGVCAGGDWHTIMTNGTSYQFVCSGQVYNSTNFPADIWTHLVITYDNSNVKFYKDGTLINTVVQTESGAGDAQAYAIGRSGGYSGGYFNGMIDEVRIYNDDLSAAEIARHYNNDFSQDPTANLVMLHHFEEGTTCTSGSCITDDDDEGVNDGTPTNFDNLSTWDNGTDGWVSEVKKPSWRWGEGKYGQAGKFNGDGDNVNIAYDDSLNITEEMTISAWVKPTGNMTKGGGIVRRGTWGWAVRYFVLTLEDSKFVFQIQRIDTSATMTAYSETISVDNWYHVSAIFYSNNIEVYVNGVLSGSNFASSSYETLRSGSAGILIGKEYDGGGGIGGQGDHFDGAIDDVRIYNYARTADEIRLDYNAGAAARFGPLSGCDEDPGSCMRKGLVGSWNFDEGIGTTATDASGYGNNGTLTNNPTWTTGKIKGGLEFDGYNDYVEVANSDSLNMGTSNFSASMWTKPNTGISKIWKAPDDGAGAEEGYYLIAYLSGTNYSYLGDGSSHQFSFTPSAYPQSNEWNHIVWVIDRDNDKLYQYLNGVDVSNGGIDISAATGSLDSIGKLYIQAYNSGGTWYCNNGEVDEVRIYNRALSATEVRYHYNKGGPVAYWKFNEGEGQTAYDNTDNNNDGTLGASSASGSDDPTWVEGKYGSALSFDGTDDYVGITHSAILDMTSEITVEAWIKQDSGGGVAGSTRTISSAGTNSKWEFKTGNDGLFIFVIEHTDSSETAVAVTFPLDTWTHLTGTFKNGEFRMYENGAKMVDKIPTSTGIKSYGDSRIRMGRETTGTIFNGLIDDVRIYNYARTQEQVLQDYNAGAAIRFK